MLRVSKLCFFGIVTSHTIASVAFQLPAPGIFLTLGGYFGLLFAGGFRADGIHGLLTGSGAGQVAGTARRHTGCDEGPGGDGRHLQGLVVLGAEHPARFSFMGGFLLAGMVIALIASLGVVFLQIPALGMDMAAMVALLSAGMMLFETSRIVNSGETNYVLPTVSRFVRFDLQPIHQPA